MDHPRRITRDRNQSLHRCIAHAAGIRRYVSTRSYSLYALSPSCPRASRASSPAPSFDGTGASGSRPAGSTRSGRSHPARICPRRQSVSQVSAGAVADDLPVTLVKFECPFILLQARQHRLMHPRPLGEGFTVRQESGPESVPAGGGGDLHLVSAAA